MKKVYIVIKLSKNEVPEILGVFKKRSDAEAEAYGNPYKGWVNIIEKEVK